MAEKELTTYLKRIKQEKNEKLTPDILKSGITFLGVTGILESDGTTSVAEYEDNLELCQDILGKTIQTGGEE